MDIINARKPISPARLRDALVDQLNPKLIAEFNHGHDCVQGWNQDSNGTVNPAAALPQLPDRVSVSVVLATYDRPVQLNLTLKALREQDSSREIEIVVVDNHPSSGLTPPIVAQYPGVVLVSEHRPGLAYARNAGFVISRGDIVVATDDDVMMPPDWLELLLAPFIRNEIAIVTGNVLPYELETESQYLFEEYGGLGRGFNEIEAGLSWLTESKIKAAPTWELGATANAAFRAKVFRDPRIGLMDEARDRECRAALARIPICSIRLLKQAIPLYIVLTHLCGIRIAATLRRSGRNCIITVKVMWPIISPHFFEKVIVVQSGICLFICLTKSCYE